MADHLGRVTQVSPLQVRLNGTTGSIDVVAMNDFTGATAGVDNGTEVLVKIIESRAFAWRVPAVA